VHELHDELRPAHVVHDGGGAAEDVEEASPLFVGHGEALAEERLFQIAGLHDRPDVDGGANEVDRLS
jgi:hypothetical protein